LWKQLWNLNCPRKMVHTFSSNASTWLSSICTSGELTPFWLMLEFWAVVYFLNDFFIVSSSANTLEQYISA
jgi:hypothetical protein